MDFMKGDFEIVDNLRDWNTIRWMRRQWKPPKIRRQLTPSPETDTVPDTGFTLRNRDEDEINSFLQFSALDFNDCFNNRKKQEDDYKEFMELRTLGRWAEIVSTYTLPEVKKMLNNPEPPTIDDIERLPWVDTTESGVYAHLFQPVLEGHHSHVYIGEASGHKGLAERRKQHEKEIRKGADEKLSSSYHYNVYRSSPRTSNWTILFLLPDLDVKKNIDEKDRDWSDECWSEARVICYLAEAIFARMLGAYARSARKDLASVCPFGVNLPWFGTCSHSSLTDGVITAHSAERSIERTRQSKKKYFASFYPTYKAKLTGKDMDRLADNTRRHRQQRDADGAEHLTRRKELKSSWSRANDPIWKAQANAKRRVRDAEKRREKAEKEAAGQMERMT
ncbi:hypothetical protein EAF04_004334 [Stromatinia cepivora]|nr:hypothetical protein EAF04_004334 [Stromatinia cepivora]